MTLTAELVATPDDLLRLAPEWDELLARSAVSEATQSPLWINTWWKCFGDESRALRAIAFRDGGGRLVGWAPLLSRLHWYKGAIPFRRLELLGSGEKESDEIASDYIGVTAEAGREVEVARAFAHALVHGGFGQWDELVMTRMNGDAPMTRALIAEIERSVPRIERFSDGNAYFIRLPQSWDAYLAELSSSRRYRMRRALKEFDQWAGGDLVLERARSGAELPAALATLVDLHGQRWRADGKPGVFASETFTRFHQRVMPSLLALGALDLLWLRARGQPVAALYNIVWQGRVLFYQSGRRVDLPEKLRPGTIIHALAIRDAIERGLREYDFLGGQSRYKEELALGTRPLVGLRAVRVGLWREAARSIARGARELLADR